jgi:hypothetical protein
MVQNAKRIDSNDSEDFVKIGKVSVRFTRIIFGKEASWKRPSYSITMLS